MTALNGAVNNHVELHFGSHFFNTCCVWIIHWSYFNTLLPAIFYLYVVTIMLCSVVFLHRLSSFTLLRLHTARIFLLLGKLHFILALWRIFLLQLFSAVKAQIDLVGQTDVQSIWQEVFPSPQDLINRKWGVRETEINRETASDRGKGEVRRGTALTDRRVNCE